MLKFLYSVFKGKACVLGSSSRANAINENDMAGDAEMKKEVLLTGGVRTTSFFYLINEKQNSAYVQIPVLCF